MGYPWDERYIDKLRKNKKECEDVKTIFYALRLKEANKRGCDTSDLSLKEQFSLLGEAFELGSETLNVVDQYHFLWDVLEELLGEY